MLFSLMFPHRLQNNKHVVRYEEVTFGAMQYLGVQAAQRGGEAPLLSAPAGYGTDGFS